MKFYLVRFRHNRAVAESEWKWYGHQGGSVISAYRRLGSARSQATWFKNNGYESEIWEFDEDKGMKIE